MAAVQVSQRHQGNGSKMMNLSFLLRPPVTDEEISAAAPHIHEVINSAYDVYRTQGTESLLRYLSEKNSRKQNLCTDQSQLMDGNGDGNDDDDAKISGDPRAYQLMMVERAKKQNTIVQLNTGLGKTLIAILTIKHFADDYKKVNSNGLAKQTWFLVPSVALAIQQSHTLRVNLPYKVAVVCHTAAKSDKARAEISAADICVLTHGSALELLQHYNDIFCFSRVNLIVVDECHHAVKKHNYTNIFRQFYHKLPKESRPRVLGLTATPIINIPKNITERDLESMLRDLESTLDSSIVSLENLGLSSNSQSGVICSRTKETSILYQDAPADTSIFLDHSDIGLHKSRIKEFNQLLYVLEQFGPVVVWRYSEVVLKEISHNYYEKESAQQFVAAKNHLTKVCDHFRNITESTGGKTEKLMNLEKLLRNLYGASSFEDTIGIVFVQRRISALSLKHYFSLKTDDCNCNHVESKKNTIRSGLLTRKTTDVFKYLSSVRKLSENQQEEAHKDWLHTIQDTKAVLNSLRCRDINLLFATSVVEEGVDIDACSFVIVLDELQTTKTYVQMKGRARQLDANFFVFQNVHNQIQKPPLTLSDAKNIDTKISAYLGSRKEFSTTSTGIGAHSLQQLSLGGNVFDYVTSGAEANSLSRWEEEAVINELYHASKGMVDLASSKSLVNRYCSCIPMDLHARSSRVTMRPYLPVYQNTQLLLPSHLPPDIRYIKLPEKFRTNSKKKNESLLALIACVRLHKHSVLNERLLPLKRGDIQQKLRSSALKILKRVPVEYFRSTCTENSNLKEIFIYPLIQKGSTFEQNNTALGGSRGLCLITFRSLSQTSKFSLKLVHQQLGMVHCSIGRPKSKTINFTELDICQKFYLTLMNARWRRRTGRSRFRFLKASRSTFPQYIVSCLTHDGLCLDLKHMQSITEEFGRSENERKDAAQKLSGKPRLFAPIYDPNNTYIALRTENRPCSSPFPDKGFASFADYTLKTWGFKVSGDSKLVHVQRCWDVPSKALEGNLHTETNVEGASGIEPDQECKNLKSMSLLMDACMEAPMSDPSLFLHCIMLPQLLYELERMETMNRFISHCSRWPHLYDYIKEVPFEDVTTAMTAKSCALDKNSYDRLEYLGDAVLKVLHTDALINSDDDELRHWFHCLHEGDLTELRTAMGCNDRLKDVAQCAGFDSFILTTPLGKGTWIPAGLEPYTVDDGENGITTKKLKQDFPFKPSGKIIADVVESILGLIYIHYGYDAVIKVASELDISPPRSTKAFHQMNPPQVGRIDANLLSQASTFLGSDQFVNSASNFVMEAFTHPTKMNSSNYQRLEWIGDAVLCLAAREWVYKHFPSFSVKELVTIETILICNETLAMIAFSSGLHRHIIHCDSTLPARLEAYEFQVEQNQQGLWSTDPPKVLADVVEALIGVAHISGGLRQGQERARHVIKSMLDSVSDHFAQEGTMDRKMIAITHPVQAISETCPSVKIRSYNINDYRTRYNSKIWFGKRWDYCSDDKIFFGNVGQITYNGLSLCEVADKNSRSVAKMRSSSLLFSILNESKCLRLKIEKMAKALADIDKKK